MNRKSHSPKRKKGNASEVAREIIIELRNICMRIDALREPFQTKEITTEHPDSEFRFWISGALSFEQVHGDIATVAGMVWHLKDRLAKWMSASDLHCNPAINEIAESHLALKLCADLIDSKKHGDGCNRSGYLPKLDGLSLRPNGKVGMKYDGPLALGEFVSSSPDPVPYSVELISGNSDVTFGNAIEVVCNAFEKWQQFLFSLPFFKNGDPASMRAKEMLSRLATKDFPLVRSDLVRLRSQ